MLQHGNGGLLEISDLYFHDGFPVSVGESVTLVPGLPLRLLPEFSGRLPEGRLECARKRFRIFKTGIQRDIGDALKCVEDQPVRGTLESHQLDIAHDADAAVFGELAVKMELREVRDLAQLIHSQVVIKVAVDMIEHLVEPRRV